MAAPSTVRQWVTSQDGLDNLRFETADMNAPGPDEKVLVKVHCVALNFRDTEGDYHVSREVGIRN